jgi:hypothetical protein
MHIITMILTKKGYSGQSIFKMNNADMYEWEYFSKYPQYGYSHRKIGFSIDNLWEPKKKILSRKKKDYEPLNPMQTQTDP